VRQTSIARKAELGDYIDPGTISHQDRSAIVMIVCLISALDERQAILDC
jgi:hypothetical protein